MECAGCAHPKEEHASGSCTHVLERDRLGFVKTICDCPVFIEPVRI